MTASLAPAAPASPPLDLPKGAWGGAWTVVYGCLALMKGLLIVWTIGLVEGLSRWGSAAIHARAAGEEEADAAQLVAEMVERIPEAFGAPLVPWMWAGAAICAACVVAGHGVVRRSETARRASIALLAASAVHSIAVTVAWAVQGLPVYEAWLATLREVLDDVQRANPDVGRDLGPWLQASGTQQLIWEAAMQVVHLGLVGLLIARLRGPECRAWVTPVPPGAATPPAPGRRPA